MEGHEWDWSDHGGGEDADTADLGGDPSADLGGHDLGGHDLGGLPFGESGDFGHDGGDGGEDLGHLTQSDHGDLEEPLGTEHAAETYDQSLHDDPSMYDAPDHDTGHDTALHEPALHADIAGQHADEHEDAFLHDGPGHDGSDHQDAFDHTGPGHEVDQVAADHDPDHGDQYGNDPDVHGNADDPAWHETLFPAELHLQDPPEPVDGFPWSDATVLGGPEHGHDPATVDGDASSHDLAQYDSSDAPAGNDPWRALLGSEDPATSSLAHWWAPQS